MTEMGNEFFWQLSDPDQQGYFREGHGEHALLKEIRAHASEQDKDTPEGFVSGGNLALYWCRKNIGAGVA